MNKKALFFSFIVCIVLFIFWSKNETSQNMLETKTNLEVPIKTSVKVEPIKKQRVFKKKKPQVNKPPLKKKKLRNVNSSVSQFQKNIGSVFFKIKDGMAITSGDILLGEVSSKSAQKYKEGALYKDKPKHPKKWKEGEIFYGFSKNLPPTLLEKVKRAINYYNLETNIHFLPLGYDDGGDALIFSYRENAPCSSYLGRVGGYQPIYLNMNCGFNEILHEIMHALGFVHEQQRLGRDEVIDILWDNIKPEYQYNFSILPDAWTTLYKEQNFTVNFKSIMMYKDSAFAKSGLKSMRSLTGEEIAPISGGLSKIDKERLEFSYN